MLAMRADGPSLACPPAQYMQVYQSIVTAFEAGSSRRVRVLLLPSDLRRAVSRAFRAGLPRAAFLSHEEVNAARVQTELVAAGAMPEIQA